MTVLSPAQRKLLSDTVSEARDVVEAACAQRLAALGVAADRAPDNLSDEERRLRRALRARARQLGSMEILVSEAGYEHWHRMLFTRFLADNNLLVDDHTAQPVSMDEVADYAAELGVDDVWEVAARFGAAMLPGIFRHDDPLLQMRLPVETRQCLEELLSGLPPDIITADDALGWAYQYWQARRKDEVNRSERKIGGADLAPVTQLFTDDYMVRFLLENSLGAWWASRHPDSPLLAEWQYLRFSDDGTPAAGAFDSWPNSAAEVTVMDPCCGSGHFLVAAFEMLWRMRTEEEALDAAAAQDFVLRDNLFGLELDPRCTQFATFALALQAWKASGYRVLPLPNVACTGIPAKAPVSNWTELAEGDYQLEAALRRLHTLFINADTLGSLIDPIGAAEDSGLESVDWHVIAPLLSEALRNEGGASADPASAVFGDAAIGISRAAALLSRRYVLVVTNPPYLGRSQQSELLRHHCMAEYPRGAHDLATVFMERAISLGVSGGAQMMVLPQGWLFLKRYRDLREMLLTQHRIAFVAQLGEKAFQSPAAAGAFVCLAGFTNAVPSSRFMAIDATGADGPAAKAAVLALAEAPLMQDLRAVSAAGIPIRLASGSQQSLSDRARAWQGLVTGDSNRYCMRFWEVSADPSVWERFASAPDRTAPFRGRTLLLRYEKGRGALMNSPGAHNFNPPHVLGRAGVLIAQVRNLAVTFYAGEYFNDASCPLIPEDISDLPAIWAYCSSGEYSREVRARNQSLVVRPGYLTRVPFDREHWRSVAAELYPDGLPEPSSNDPTQWLFNGNPAGSTNPLQVAVGRLVGYVWPDQVDTNFAGLIDADGVVCLPPVGGELPAAERVLHLLSDAYGKGWSPSLLDSLLNEVGAKSGAAGLADWLRNGFFRDHCNIFLNRPFIWQIWDGTADGFSALLNSRKLDRKLLERITYEYLGNWWLGRIRSEVTKSAPGAQKRLAAAEQLKDKLQMILEGEPPYDIYVRWKTLAEQPVGWDPDLDDGVRLNIRPFMTAGILRSQPKINWNKDRGKNPDGSDRLNDLHYSLAEKRAARGISR